MHGVNGGLKLIWAIATIGTNGRQIKLRQFIYGLGWADPHHGKAFGIKGHGGNNGQMLRSFACASNGGLHLH